MDTMQVGIYHSSSITDAAYSSKMKQGNAIHAAEGFINNSLEKQSKCWSKEGTTTTSIRV